MKFMVGLSSCALVALSISPSLAANRAIGSATVRPLSDRSLPAGTKTIQVAESIDSFTRSINTIARIQKRSASEKRKQDAIERQEKLRAEADERRAIREQRIEELRLRLQREADKGTCPKPKSEHQQRIEAAREKIFQERAAEIEKQKYLESLTPEQREEYLARQRSTPAAVGGSSPIKVSSPEMGKNSAAPSDRDSTPESRDKNSDNSSLKPQPSSAPDRTSPTGGEF